MKKQELTPDQKKQRLLLRVNHMIKNKARKKYLQFWVLFEAQKKKPEDMQLQNTKYNTKNI